MEKVNLRFDWVCETDITKHWDDLTRDELLMYIDWLEQKIINSSTFVAPK